MCNRCQFGYKKRPGKTMLGKESRDRLFDSPEAAAIRYSGAGAHGSVRAPQEMKNQLRKRQRTGRPAAAAAAPESWAGKESAAQRCSTRHLLNCCSVKTAVILLNTFSYQQPNAVSSSSSRCHNPQDDAIALISTSDQITSKLCMIRVGWESQSTSGSGIGNPRSPKP